MDSFLEVKDKNNFIFKDKWGVVCFFIIFLECLFVLGF